MSSTPEQPQEQNPTPTSTPLTLVEAIKIFSKIAGRTATSNLQKKEIHVQLRDSHCSGSR